MLDRSIACEMVRQAGWLAETPPAFREAVLAESAVLPFDKGDWIYRSGDQGGGLWAVADGGIHVEFTQGASSPRFAIFASTGFWAGQATILTGSPRQIGLRATRPTVMLHLPRPAFLAIAATDPEAWRWIGILTFHHMVAVIGLREDATLRNPQDRVCATLTRMTQTQWGGPPPRDQRSVTIDFSQEELADLCNVSRSFLATLLNRLRRDGLIDLAYRQVIIPDPARFRLAFVAIPTDQHHQPMRHP